MGDYKKIYCKKGLHKLEGDNLEFNSEGFRCCRRCHLDARNKKRKEKHDFRRIQHLSR